MIVCDTGEICTTCLEYDNSIHWRELRERLYQNRFVHGLPKCELCGKSDEYGDMTNPNKIRLHHKTYERLGKELEEDLIFLCGSCHSIEHAEYERKNGCKLERNKYLISVAIAKKMELETSLYFRQNAIRVNNKKMLELSSVTKGVQYEEVSSMRQEG